MILIRSWLLLKYLVSHFYFGVIIGCFANCIAKGVFQLDGVRYYLEVVMTTALLSNPQIKNDFKNKLTNTTDEIYNSCTVIRIS